MTSLQGEGGRGPNCTKYVEDVDRLSMLTGFKKISDTLLHFETMASERQVWPKIDAKFRTPAVKIR